jgi:hypothetical protein
VFFRRNKPAPAVVPDALPASAPTAPPPAAGPPGASFRAQINGFKGSFLIFLALTPQGDHPCLLDVLMEEPQTLEVLATQCGWQAGKAHQIFLALTGIGFLTMTPEGQFGRGPLGTALVTQPVLRIEAELAARVLSVAAAQGLPTALVTGEDGFAHAFGMNFYQYLGTHQDDARRFGTFMHLLTQPIATLFARSYPAIGDRGTVVDVGAGDATLLTSILEAYPQVQGIAFDRTTDAAQQTISRLAPDVAARLTSVAGNFLETIPSGDAVVLMQVLHNLGDALAIQVLTNSGAAITSGGVVLVVEQILPPQVTTMTPAVEQNLNMAILFADGRERTQVEYAALLNQAGLTLHSVIPLAPSPFNIIEAVKI